MGFNLKFEQDFHTFHCTSLIVSSAQAKLWISAPNAFQVCSFVLLCVLYVQRDGTGLDRDWFLSPQISTEHIVGLVSTTSWHLELICIHSTQYLYFCLAAWWHNTALSLKQLTASLWGEYTRRLFLTQATPKLHQTGTSDSNCIVNLVNF